MIGRYFLFFLIFVTKNPQTFVYSTNSIYFKQTQCSQGRLTNLYDTDPKQSIRFWTLFVCVQNHV